MNEIYLELKPVEHKDTWILWEIEDRIAERISSVFCSPSIAAAEKQFNEILQKQNTTPGELVMNKLAVYESGVIKALV